MADPRHLVLIAAAFAVSCGRPTAPLANNTEADASPAISALEQVAQQAGVVADTSASPIGLYRSRHEAGQDSLCIVKGKDGAMRFGLEAAFGEHSECHGSGAVRRSGDRLIMNFDRSACLVVADYEGDRVALPGALDVECDRLCSERGTLEGVSFPRVSRDEGVARDARDKKGNSLCT